MHYFFYCRDRAGATATRKALIREHWAFMSRYVEMMVARGPTMSADGRMMTGSMHIVDLPDGAAARAFAHGDPFAAAGLFDEIRVHRFRNEAGRTMWQYHGNPANPRFLFIGEAGAGAAAPAERLLAAQREYLAHPDRSAQVIVWGPLLREDGVSWCGTALMLETRDGAAAQALVAGDPLAQAGSYARSDLMPWRFGGEQNLAGPCRVRPRRRGVMTERSLFPRLARTPIVLAFAVGASSWIGASVLTGRKEPWDAPVYWWGVYPLSLAVCAWLGYRYPAWAWLWAIVLFEGQFVGMVLRNGELGNLWPLGLMLFAVLALPGVLAGRLGARAALRGRDTGQVH